MVLRCAVVGLTSIGTRHALGIVGDERAVLVAGCDDGYAKNDGKTAGEVGAAFKARYAEEFPELRIYSSHEEMLAKEPLDIVTVGVSDHRHAEIVVNAANAGVKGIFCEKPLATTLEDTDRMLAACEKNGTVLSIDHTRRFLPIWRYAKEQLVDKGEIGDVQYLIGRLHGSRAMMWRNGTHVLDCLCWFAGSKPAWVTGDFEEGFEEYDRYGQRGMDGGKDPALEPAVNGYISFENGVKAFFAGGSKNTPSPKMLVEIVGSTGRITLDNAGDGRGPDGSWTGTYTATAQIFRDDGTTSSPVPEEIVPSDEYIAGVTPLQPGGKAADGTPEGADARMVGISAGVHDLINVIAGYSKALISPGKDGQNVVEVMAGFVASANNDNAKVRLPLARVAATAEAVEQTAEAVASEQMAARI